MGYIQAKTFRILAMTHRLRRCHISVPGSNEKMLLKSTQLEVDVVMIDLEDAVAPSEKANARNLVAHLLKQETWRAPTVSVRINALSSEHCYQDILHLMDHDGAPSARPQTLILPKTQRSSDLLFVDQLLTQIEARRGLDHTTGLEALVEDATGMLNVSDIATACERLETLIFGMGDFAASQRIDTLNIGDQGGYAGDLWHYPRYQLIMAARAHGLEPVDGPYAMFKDATGLALDCSTAKHLGMTGKWAIHPDQIMPITNCFTPSLEAIAQARAQHVAYEAALEQGLGAVSVDGVMVDQASIKLTAPLLAQAALLGL